LTRHVVDAADRWFASESSVAAVMIVEMQEQVELIDPLSL